MCIFHFVHDILKNVMMTLSLDKHCIQMVEAGVSKKLLALVEKNNTPSGDIRLQHALLSALRYAAYCLSIHLL
jgi:hypothetical protein